jgi:hypothetical protein
MPKAIYYPFADVTNDSILKAGLVLWDKLQFIAPWKGYEPRSPNSLTSRIHEILVEPFHLTDGMKARVHDEIEELLGSDLPSWFWKVPKKKQHRYTIYPDKILPKTWQLLRRSHYAFALKRAHGHIHGPSDSSYAVSNHLGLTLMSKLADVAAGGQKKVVTDLGDAYTTLNRLIVQAQRGQVIDDLEVSGLASGPDSGYGVLVNISLKTLNLDSVPITRLLELRESEERSNNTLLFHIRRNYFNHLEKFTGRMATEVSHEGDFNEVISSFAVEAEADLKDLKTELRMNKSDVLLSTEVISSVVVAAAVGVSLPMLLPALGVGGILGIARKVKDYRRERKKTLKNHPMAWLYLAAPNRYVPKAGTMF